MLQKCQVFTLSLQKSTKKLDGWEIIWRVTQRAGQEVCLWRKNCCFCDRQLPSQSSYWQPKSIHVVFATTYYYFQDPTNGSKFHPPIESKIPLECCPDNYSKCREKENPSESFVAARNANFSLRTHYRRKRSWIAFESLEYPPKARKPP